MTAQVNKFIRRVVLATFEELKREEIQEALGLKHRKKSVENYLNPAINQGYIEMT